LLSTLKNDGHIRPVYSLDTREVFIKFQLVSDISVAQVIDAIDHDCIW